mmetsp:Transcript_7697/g.11934  ORF Transcript_7697/g.11934 Transcript_7697/m.11934 type:complete len:82 (+) Transcript_7697:1529-1774(+)
MSEPRPPRQFHADPNLVTQLMEMGFTKAQCKAALKKTKNNMERALDQLLNNGDQFLGLDNSNDSVDQELVEEQRMLEEQIL